MSALRHIRLPDNDEPLWVFGYGSLMWDPGFNHDTRHVARIFGLHRRLCVSSIRYRGTPKRPGLVLGLDLGGSCRGYLYRVRARDKLEVAAYLEEREMVNQVYKPVYVTVNVDAGTKRRALTFRVRRDHPQYIPRICEKKLAARVVRSHGLKGPNKDYVLNTLNELRSHGFDDIALDRIARYIESHEEQFLSGDDPVEEALAELRDGAESLDATILDA